MNYKSFNKSIKIGTTVQLLADDKLYHVIEIGSGRSFIKVPGKNRCILRKEIVKFSNKKVA